MNCGVSGPEQDLLYVNFNQDHSCLSVGTRRGFRIYNCEPFGKCYERGTKLYCYTEQPNRYLAEDGAAAGICEMLFSSSLVAIAGAGEPPTFSPRKLQIINTKRQTVVCELNFPSKVLTVHMNRKRLVVVLDTKIHIYDLSTMKIVHTIETPSNPLGVCSLSPNADTSLLAYPSDNREGILQIFNSIDLKPVCAIQAHRATITKVAFNIDGTLLATASDKGTILRVFSATAGQKLYQFRRGTYPAVIHCLTFNLQSNMLCVTSDSDTVHIFKFPSSPQSSGSGSTIMSAILPERVGEALDSVRDFAHIKLSASNIPSLCSLSSTMPHLMLVTADGQFLVYSIDLEKGGECKLLRKHSFNPKEEAKSISAISL